MIVFDRVSKVYPDGTTAVDELSLTAPSGEITVLVGPSGCGKSTSLRMINRLIDPTSGTVTLDGEDTTTVDRVALRRKIGYVIQNAGLFPHRTVLDNVAALPRLLGGGKQATRTRAAELLELVGLSDTFADRYPWQLSGGQQQRVGVARALATDPPFLLMDEPFSAVDPIVRAQLQDEFLRLQDTIGKTIVLVTHDVDEALKLGDRIAVLRRGGQLAQLAAPRELLARPADRFVADFVGRARGYRGLGFLPIGSDLPVQEAPAAVLGASPADLPATAEGWFVAVDGEGRPRGWVHRGSVGGPLAEDDVQHAGISARSDGALKDVLDAALSSPVGHGIVVDADGRLAGMVSTEDVVAAVGRARSAAASGADR